MRKIVTLILILGIASMASAAISLVESSIDIAVGDAGTINLASDSTGGWDAYVVSPNISAIAEIADNAGANGYANDSGAYGGAPYYYWDVGAADLTSPFTELPVAGNQFAITVNDGGLGIGGSYIVKLVDTGFSEIGSTTVNIIPEPATIALLGLGGLLLRKRKK